MSWDITFLILIFSVYLQFTTPRTLYDLIRFLLSHENECIRKSKAALLPMKMCGEISSESRIVGGKIAHLEEFPWMALLSINKDRGSFRGDGFVINKRYVLTAAHCVTSARSVHVSLGEYDTSQRKDCDSVKNYCSPPVQQFTIHDIERDIIVHDEYIGEENDIALIRLPRPADFTVPNVKPICLPINTNTYLDEKLVTVTGWGKTETGEISNKLRRVILKVMPNKDCKKFQLAQGITSKQICAVGDRKDSCDGDSGGPLQRIENVNGVSKYVVHGIVSYGTSHCGIGIPGVYTRVSSYIPWILENLDP